MFYPLTTSKLTKEFKMSRISLGVSENIIRNLTCNCCHSAAHFSEEKKLVQYEP